MPYAFVDTDRCNGRSRASIDEEDTPVALEDEPEGYDAWFRARVQEALDDPTPDVPNEEVMAYMDRRRAARHATAR